MIINSIMELHGKRSTDGKFTVNIDKGYLAVATIFADDKARIVYSEPLNNTENILKDLHRVWGFSRFILAPTTQKPMGIEVIVDRTGRRMLDYNRREGKVTIFTSEGAEWFQKYDDWDECLEYACNNKGCTVKVI